MADRTISAGRDLTAAGEWVAEAVVLADRAGNRHEWLHAQVFGAALRQAAGDDEAAAATFAEIIGEFRRLGERRCVTRCLLGPDGRPPTVATPWQRAARCLLGLGRAAVHRGDAVAARRYLTECADVASALGEPERVAAAERELAALRPAATGSRPR